MTGFAYTFGIEEEYFLSHADDGSLAARMGPQWLEQASSRLGHAVTSELLQSQVEIATPILRDMCEAGEVLGALRTGLARLLEEKALRLMAASTHPLGAWRDQHATAKPRYDQLMSDFRIIGQRNLVCGMHVHVAVPHEVDRVQLMNRAMHWLPLFLALSTSSPFWNRHPTGLKSYRQSVYDEWPRSGIPDFFADQADYDAFAALLRRSGALKDASYLWWAIRPALKYPTLELRIADVCTSIDHALALAALFRCLIAMLVRDPEHGQWRSAHTRRLIDENRWRARRDGIGAQLIDERSATALPVPQVAARLLELVAPEAEELDRGGALRGIERILADGTSADTQLRLYAQRREAGDEDRDALRVVTDWLMSETVKPRPGR
jgi:carboxylate-amine ligase